MSYIIAYASFHVEDVAKDLPLLEGAEPEAEFPLQPEEVIEDQEQDLEQDLIDFYNTQGKHRFMYTPVSYVNLILCKPRFILKPSVTTLSLSPTITTLFMH